MEEHRTITHRHLTWDIIVFVAVIVSVISMSIEFTLDLSERELGFLFIVDAAAMAIFLADLWVLWTHYNGPLREFIFRNWLDVLACIPVFRLIRIARYARVLKLARLRRLNKLKRAGEVTEKIDEDEERIETIIKLKREG